MQYLKEAGSINIIVREFSYNRLKLTENKLPDVFADFVRIVNKSVLYK